MNIDIPENYLLWIATHGNMGTGELPKIMQNWAIRKINENGLNNKLEKLQIEKIKMLKEKLTNVIGDDGMNLVNKNINEAKEALNFVNGKKYDN